MNIIKKCIYRFSSFIKNLLKQEKKDYEIKQDYNATPEEEWFCNGFLPPFSNARFKEEKGDGYKAFFEVKHSIFVL